ncbi:hypothetical protein CLOP_g19018 [Closterium sp. NIES-67]|nr:hypothetical protein CLOP_g19018 [Closterium sp. NIES-67]
MTTSIADSECTGQQSNRGSHHQHQGLPSSANPRQQQPVESQHQDVPTDDSDVEYGSQQELESEPLVRRQSSDRLSNVSSTSRTSDSASYRDGRDINISHGKDVSSSQGKDGSCSYGKDQPSEPAAVPEPESVSIADRDAKECRICQEEDDVANLDVPCACSGSLKYAHHDCIQRWCNEKGNTQCEICHHPFREGYTAPPPPPSPPITPGLVALQFRDGAGQLSHIVTFRDAVTGEELRFGLEDLAATPVAPEIPEPASVSCIKSLIILVLLLIFARHFFALVLEVNGDDDDVDEDSAEFTMFLMQLLGILLPCFILVRALAAIHERYRQEFAEAEAAEAASRLSHLLQSHFNTSAARARSGSSQADVALTLDFPADSSASSASSSSSSSAASSPAASPPASPAGRRRLFPGFRGGFFGTLLQQQQQQQQPATVATA